MESSSSHGKILNIDTERKLFQRSWASSWWSDRSGSASRARQFLSNNIVVANCRNRFFFSICVFFNKDCRLTGQQGKREDIYLTLLYHFHPLYRHPDISQAIATEISPLHIVSSRTRTGNFGLQGQVAKH